MTRIFFDFDKKTGDIKAIETADTGEVVLQRVPDNIPEEDDSIRPGRKRLYDPQCSVDGCVGKHRAKGYCGMHYERMRRNGSAMVTKRAYRKRAKEPWDVKRERDNQTKLDAVTQLISDRFEEEMKDLELPGRTPASSIALIKKLGEEIS